MNDKIQFILKLLHEYQKDKLIDKYNLIIKALVKSDVYINKRDYLITIESNEKHHFPIYLSLSDEEIKSNLYEKISINDLMEIINAENNKSNYKIDDLLLEPNSKDCLEIQLYDLKNIKGERN